MVAVSAVGLACSGPPTGFACTASVEPTFILEIRDSITGAARAPDAVARVTDGGYSDTLRLVPGPDPAYRLGPDERAGIYALSVTHPGYQPWSAAGLVVLRGQCHVETRRLVVLLQP